MAALFSRRAGDDEIAAELATLYPGAPAGLAASFDERAPRAGDRLTTWIHDQVHRAAVLEAARSTGLDQAAYPPDGAESLRVYLAEDVADAPGDQVPAAFWAQARDEAWGDHGDGLAEDRIVDWSEQLADQVAATVSAWRAG